VIRRVVFDTTVVVSAMVFANGRLAWLRGHWATGDSVPLVSRFTVAELTRVLTYPKFQLSADDRRELLGEYLPYCEIIKVTTRCNRYVGMQMISRSSTWPRAGKPIFWSAAIETCWLSPERRDS
jgi:predicted nucleic acid-binding protein